MGEAEMRAEAHEGGRDRDLGAVRGEVLGTESALDVAAQVDHQHAARDVVPRNRLVDREHRDRAVDLADPVGGRP